MLKEQIFSWK